MVATSPTADALHVIRLLKNRSTEDAVWNRVEKVLLSEEDSEVECQEQIAEVDGFLSQEVVVRYDDDRLAKALLFIHQHLGDCVGVQDITQEICVSRRWLEYAFRAAFGITPFQYLRCVRMELARFRLMSEPGCKVHEIAQDCGFTSARQFTMTFRQFFGFSPSVCRNQMVETSGGRVNHEIATSHGKNRSMLAEAC